MNVDIYKQLLRINQGARRGGTRRPGPMKNQDILVPNWYPRFFLSPAKSLILWSGRGDLNARPPAPKAGALPGCATPRHFVLF